MFERLEIRSDEQHLSGTVTPSNAPTRVIRCEIIPPKDLQDHIQSFDKESAATVHRRVPEHLSGALLVSFIRKGKVSSQ
jgi:hypothetical protein